MQVTRHNILSRIKIYISCKSTYLQYIKPYTAMGNYKYTKLNL